ncbi:MAG: bifunctional folylpolyglutamate synthase/dihydrofolate synthase [Peptoniphilaceae bacterium]|nr:bifunctional folylpolyglutamate synthase/dihydrofolate synthase [Peptoniphilaceae bacterium]MDY6018622.1 folylpolyglutamate synthase/dihydrofolate synthase family protein [Anaerococcus sp.]
MERLITKDDYLDWIYARGNSSGKKHSLEKIRKLLAEFDNPQDKIKVIHVAGTNGKGSTCRFLAKAIGNKASCGLFTSPYMVRINESISINGIDISDDDFKAYIDKLKPVVEKLDEDGFHNTYFEVLTAIMFLYFYDKKVDYAVVEVGMGGTLDCTNIIKKPIASVIATISMDHTQILGNTLTEIASNKAGIIKKDCPVFVYPQKDEAMEVIKKKAKEENAALYTFSKDEVKVNELATTYNEFTFRSYKNVKTKLIGIHQLYNASLALMVLDYFKEEFKLDENLIKQSLSQTTNPGRLEEIHKNPRVIVDGSHNQEAIDTLISSLKSFTYHRLILGFSVLEDKNHAYIIKRLAQISDIIIVTSVDNPRAMSIDAIEKEFKFYGKDVIKIADRKEAFKRSIEEAAKDDLVLWCGSLYLIGDILKFKDEFIG